MLKYRNDNKANASSTGSIINKINDIATAEEIEEKIKPLFIERAFINSSPVLIKDGTVTRINTTYFKTDTHYFYWPEDVPIKIEDINWPSGIMPKKIYKTVRIPNVTVKNIKTSKIDSYKDPYIGCDELILDNGDTTKVTNIDRMFERFWHLRKLDLSTWSFPKLKSAERAFSRMGLKELIIPKSGFPKLKNAYRMFYNGWFPNTKLDLRVDTTGPIEDAREMIAATQCSEIDLRGWKFSPTCNFEKFASTNSHLTIFNGVKLNIEGLPKNSLNEPTYDGTEICVDIIKNPEKYEQYLVK